MPIELMQIAGKNIFAVYILSNGKKEILHKDKVVEMRFHQEVTDCPFVDQEHFLPRPFPWEMPWL